MKRLFLVLVAVAAVLGSATRSSAFTISVNDNGLDNIPPAVNPAAVWTLTIDEGCVACNATLEVEFTNLMGNPYFAQDFYLDSVMFTLNGTNMIGVADLDPAWDWIVGSLSANQCSPVGGNQSACGAWNDPNPPGGFLIGGAPGPHIYSWNVLVTFDETIVAFTTGNIRAAFNDAEGGNLRIFSPGGAGAGGGAGGGAGATPSPEPAMLGLFGLALAFGAARLRRRS